MDTGIFIRKSLAFPLPFVYTLCIETFVLSMTDVQKRHRDAEERQEKYAGDTWL